jgi:predicted deacylase
MRDEIVIERRTIAGDQDGPHLLITGGVHGDEYEPMVAIRRLIRRLDAAQLAGRVTLIPVLNAQAFAARTRTGPDGLDLARTFPGSRTGSTTERIAHAAAGIIRSADYYIDLHTGGAALEVAPMTGYLLHGDAAVLDAQRRMAMAFNLPIVWGTPADVAGRSLSVARDANIPAIYGEFGGGGGCDEAGVIAYVDGCLNVMAALGMIERPAPTPRVRHIVEDGTPGAGHMQASNPAPAAGFFMPGVACGQTIAAGTVLGTITDALGDDEQTITSSTAGLVLVRRVAGPVKPGDGLAVVLDTSRKGAAV